VIEVIFLAGAEADVQAAYERRESFREGAGDHFLRELDRCAALLSRYPRIGRPHRGVYRKLLVPDNPYGVFYAVEPSRVVILAVLDLRQDPKTIERPCDLNVKRHLRRQTSGCVAMGYLARRKLANQGITKRGADADAFWRDGCPVRSIETDAVPGAIMFSAMELSVCC
jgi:plasmid stabilization system protein ParE